MKNAYVMAATVALLVLGLIQAAPAAAQVELTPEQRPICELVPASARSLCNEYYDAKQAVINKVQADITLGMTTEPGKSSLLTTVYSDIRGLLVNLGDLVNQLRDEIPEGAWSEELATALKDELESLEPAADYWARYAYLVTTLNQDIFNMNDAVDGFDDKAEVLTTVAEDLAMDWREAKNVISGDFDQAVVRDVYDDFHKQTYRVRALMLATTDLAEKIEAMVEAYSFDNRYKAYVQEVKQAAEGLDAVWATIFSREILEAYNDLSIMYSDAMYMLDERHQIMRDQSLYHEVGPPFDNRFFHQVQPVFHVLDVKLRDMAGSS